MANEGLGGVPEAYRIGAEEVRAHLVSLRGGAPFLSPADALQLVTWFDRGVTVAEILGALERAHAARRKRPSRIPLGLRQVARHLGKPVTGSLPAREVRAAPAGGGPLGPLVGVLRARAEDDRAAGAVHDLADAFEGLPDAEPETVVTAALALVREFRDRLWDDASVAQRDAARARARAELADLAHEVDAATFEALVEEEAREAVRARFSWLDAGAIWDLVEDR